MVIKELSRKRNPFLIGASVGFTGFIVYVIVEFIYKGVADYSNAAVFAITMFAFYSLFQALANRWIKKKRR